jgi:hypothetical protein
MPASHSTIRPDPIPRDRADKPSRRPVGVTTCSYGVHWPLCEGGPLAALRRHLAAVAGRGAPHSQPLRDPWLAEAPCIGRLRRQACGGAVPVATGRLVPAGRSAMRHRLNNLVLRLSGNGTGTSRMIPIEFRKGCLQVGMGNRPTAAIATQSVDGWPQHSAMQPSRECIL